MVLLLLAKVRRILGYLFLTFFLAFAFLCELLVQEVEVLDTNGAFALECFALISVEDVKVFVRLEGGLIVQVGQSLSIQELGDLGSFMLVLIHIAHTQVGSILLRLLLLQRAERHPVFGSWSTKA